MDSPRIVKLYIKCMLSFSILFKNNEVLVNNDWGKWERDKSLYGSKSLLNMTLIHFIFVTFGLGYLLDGLSYLSSIIPSITLVLGQMMPIHSFSLICSREVTQLSLILCNTHKH